jgi:hypothetical protein
MVPRGVARGTSVHVDGDGRSAPLKPRYLERWPSHEQWHSLTVAF